MQEEIFGPVLPIMTYRDIAEVPDKIEPRRNPLALYYFGKDKKEQDYLLHNVPSGGVCVNDIRSTTCKKTFRLVVSAPQAWVPITALRALSR